jgi:Uma2 family endonuclease
MTGIATPEKAVPAGYRPIDPYDDAPPDASFEVVNGVRVEKDMSVFEQFIASLIHRRLATFCEGGGLGHAVMETMFRVPGSGNDRKPDVAFVSFTRWPQARPIPRTNAWAVCPDLAGEVVSPTDKAFDVIAKVQEYFRGGVRRVWLVYSNVEQVHVYESPAAVRVLVRADTLADDDLFPGFRLPLADLFPPAEDAPADPAA